MFCDPDYYEIIKNKCTEKCGKGIKFTSDIECDDVNLISNDGCSDNCKLEKDYKCTINENK